MDKEKEVNLELPCYGTSCKKYIAELEAKLKEAEQSFKSLAEHSEAKGKDFLELEAKVKEQEAILQKRYPWRAKIADLESQLATANAKIVELDKEHEQEMIEVIKERDHREEQIDAIYEALGGTQEWSDLCDRGDDALELVASLESQLSEAKRKEEELRFRMAMGACPDCEPTYCCSGYMCGCYGKAVDFKTSDKCAPYCKDKINAVSQLSALNKRAEGLVEASEEALDFFNARSDADCVGDPPTFKPNVEMRLAQMMEQAIKEFRGEK